MSSSNHYEYELRKLLEEAREALQYGDTDETLTKLRDDLAKRIDSTLARVQMTGTADPDTILKVITKSAQELGQIRVDQCFEGMAFARLQRVHTQANAYLIEFRAPVVPDVRYLEAHYYDLDGAQNQRSLIVKTDGVKMTVRDVMGCSEDPCAWHPDECLKVVDGKLKPDPDAEEQKMLDEAERMSEEDPDY